MSRQMPSNHRISRQNVAATASATRVSCTFLRGPPSKGSARTVPSDYRNFVRRSGSGIRGRSRLVGSSRRQGFSVRMHIDSTYRIARPITALQSRFVSGYLLPAQTSSSRIRGLGPTKQACHIGIEFGCMRAAYKRGGHGVAGGSSQIACWRKGLDIEFAESGGP
jgi:hypothetical protein